MLRDFAAVLHDDAVGAVRVVFLNPSAQLGGAERSLLDVIQSVQTAEPDWELHLVASGDGPLVTRAEALGVRTTVVPFPRKLARLGDASLGGLMRHASLVPRALGAMPAAAAYVRELRRTLADLAPDLVHTNGFKMHVLATVACGAEVSIVWHVHDYVSGRPVMARLLRNRAHRCAAIIANSHSTALDARAVCGPTISVAPIYNAVDLRTYSPDGPIADLAALAGLGPAPAGTVRVGLVATFARWKGHEVFLQALAALPCDAPVRAYVIGGPVYETDGSQYSAAELRGRVRALGLEDRVGLTGYVADPAAAMRGLDIVVHASTRPEPFGLVIAEAMACGRAVVVSAAGGAAELVQDGVTALAHAPGDIAGLAACLGRLVTDTLLRARLGAAALASATQRFDRTRLATELVPIYREVRRARTSVQLDSAA